MPIKDYSTTPANNNASPPNGAPEGMPPNAVNDTMRQLMADTRSFYNQIEWRDWGHVPAYVSATSFTIPGDVTAVAKVGRRIRLVGSGAMGTKYGVIATSVYSTLTTVTVTLDSGSLDSSLTNVLFGFDQSNSPFSLSASQISGITAFAQTLLDDPDAATARTTLGLLSLALQSNNLTVGLNEAQTTVASAATPDIWTGTGNVINYTGTTTTTGFTAAPQAGSRRTLICAGAVQFTNGANLIVPGGANYTSAAGDRIDVVAVTTTQFRLQIYKTNGQPVVNVNNVAAYYLSAYRSGSGNVASPNDIVFDTEQVESGGNQYDNTTGIFTAPATGVYLVAYTHTSQNTSVVQLQKNGVMYDQTLTYSNAATICKLVIVPLAQNDTLKCRITVGSFYGTSTLGGIANGFTILRLT